MKNDDIRKLENFNFSEFLYKLKEESGVTFKKMAESADIPYAVLYKYTSGVKARPSLSDFYKIMKFANKSIDDFFLKLLNSPNYYTQLRYYMIHNLSDEELLLLKKLNELDNDRKQIFLNHTLNLLDMILALK